MNLNNENCDELMFQLLEGEIQGRERILLLDAIHADKIYSRQWQAWQQTVLNPNSELLVMDTGKLLKNNKNRFTPWLKYCAAAMVILAIGAGVVYTVSLQNGASIVKIEKPVNPALQIIKVPTIEPAAPAGKSNDSMITFRQKVQMMAHKEKRNLQSEDFKLPQYIPGNYRPVTTLEKSPENTVVEYREPELKQPEITKDHQPELADSINEEDGVIMTVYSENKSTNSASGINRKIQEKRNLLSRIFSMPALRIVNDSNTYTNKKVILENKEFRIIAGF